MKVRKKPIIVEAIQFKIHNLAEIQDLDTEGKITQNADNTLTIETLEGNVRARLDDWIIKGIKGELYPIKDNIFKETYEEV